MFEYLEPRTREDLFSMLDQYGPAARVLAGGTDLLVNIRQKAIEPQHLINIKNIHDLSFIEQDHDGALRIGALTLLSDVEVSEATRSSFQVITDAAKQIGSLQIRNMATIGGNICQSRKCVYYNQSHIDKFMRDSLAACIAKGGDTCHAAGKDSLFHALIGAKRCHASCCSDMLTALVCSDAAVVAEGPAGNRRIPASDFWSQNEAGTTSLRPNEIVSTIEIPAWPAGTRSCYLKYKRDSRDFAVTSVGARVTLDEEGICTDIRVVLGGIAPAPFQARSVEEALRGTKLVPDVVQRAAEALLEDVRIHGEAAEFKVAKTRRLIADAIERIGGGREPH